jgi:hypothetical protein
MEILTRTFEAAKQTAGSPERAALNCDPLTSEWMPSYRFLIREPFLMSNGSTHPTQPFTSRCFRTKSDAAASAS